MPAVEIESRLATASSATPGTVPLDELNALSALLAKAAKSITDATGVIPSYDQKQYEAVSRLVSHYIRIATLLWMVPHFLKGYSVWLPRPSSLNVFHTDVR